MSERLVIPGDGWVDVTVPEERRVLHCRTQVYLPEHGIEVALRYPTLENGKLLADKTQRGMVDFLGDYAGQGIKSGLTLYEDRFMRKRLGKDHTMFDENFQRNGQPRRWGYVLDFNRPCKEGIVEGVEINGIAQQLVLRKIGYRLLGGDQILGVMTMAPSGMVPELEKSLYEKHFGPKSLTTLEGLGVRIPDRADETVDPCILGYAQFTLPHDYQIDGKLVPHFEHQYTPSQNDGERVGVRAAGWHHHGELRCFYADLDFGPGDSYPNRSSPLVRGGSVVVKVEKSFLL